MSEKNGDKARFHRERKKKDLQRKLARELRSVATKQEAPQAPAKPAPAEA